jgi:hypothetical protein
VRAASILKWCVCQLKRVKASSLVSWLDLWPPPPYINSRARVVYTLLLAARDVCAPEKPFRFDVIMLLLTFHIFIPRVGGAFTLTMTGGVKLDQATFHSFSYKYLGTPDFSCLFSSFGTCHIDEHLHCC